MRGEYSSLADMAQSYQVRIINKSKRCGGVGSSSGQHVPPQDILSRGGMKKR